MKALILATGGAVAPFGDPPGELRILDRPLRALQEEVLTQAGLMLVDQVPDDGPWLALGDRTWLTVDTLRRFLAAAGGQPARLRVDDARFLEGTASLQQLPAPGLFELAVLPAGVADLDRAPPLTVDLGLKEAELPNLHPRMQHAARPLCVGAAMVHQLDHWSHIVRVNQLALAARAVEEKARFDAAPWWRKLGMALVVLWRARSINGYRIARALCRVGEGCDIHPTAVVEVSELGKGVKVGPHAVVRASVLGDGAIVDEHATVNLSTIGAGAHVGRFAMVNLCTLLPGAWVSWANAYQATVVGREAFVAWGATLLDMSFGKTIPVEVDGRKVDSGLHFLGVAVGHRAVIGHAVKVNYGVAVPNDAVLVAGSEGILRAWGDAPTGPACRVLDGRAVPVATRPAPPPPPEPQPG